MGQIVPNDYVPFFKPVTVGASLSEGTDDTCGGTEGMCSGKCLPGEGLCMWIPGDKTCACGFH